MIRALRFIFLLFFCTGLSAQEYTYLNYGAQEGLGVPAVNALAEGPDGVLWVGTEGGGLWKFRGTTFHPVFTEVQFVRSLVFFDNILWIGTDNGLWRGNGQEFSAVPELDGKRINRLDTAGGKLLVSTERDGLYLREKQWKQQSLPGACRAAGYWRGRWVVATSAGLFGLSASPDSLLVQYTDQAVNSLLTVGDSLYYATEKGVFGWVLAEPTELLSAPGIRVLGRQGGRLLATDGTSGYWSGTGEDWEQIRARNGLPENRIRQFLEDRFGNLWMAGLNGLILHPAQSFTLISPPGGSDDQKVWSACRTGDQLLIGGERHLWRYDRDGFSAISGLPPGIVFAMQSTEMGVLLGSEAGLFLLRNGRVESLGITNHFVFDIAEGNGEWHLATSGGWMRLRREGDQLVPDTLPLVAGAALGFRKGEDGSIYTLGIGEGLHRWNGKQLRLYDHWGGLRLDTLSWTDWAVGADELFLGTPDRGVEVLGNHEPYFLDAEQGLLDPEVLGLLHHSTGLWVVTRSGIHNFHKQKDQWELQFRRSLSRDWGGSRMNARALHLVGDELLLGTTRGLLRADLAALLKERSRPVLALLGVSPLFGSGEELVQFAKGRQPWGALPEGLVLPYDQNYLRFQLEGRFAGMPEDLKYFYILEGQDKDVTPAGNRAEAIFTDISPGHYTFKAWAEGPGGQKSNMVSFSFEIRPPFWKTIWFRILAFLAAGGALYGLVRWRINRIRDRARLERDLVDMERKALSLQMNPHFIFNALDSISGFIFKQDAREAVKYLGHFAKLMRSTLEASQEHFIPLQTETDILRHYLELEQLRHNHRFTSDLSVDPDLPEGLELPPMLVQPHVENAIKHGLKPLSEGGILAIRFAREGDQLVVTIEDNGIGREKSREMQARSPFIKPKSMATEIGRRRVELLNRTWNGQVSMEIKDLYHPDGSARGTRVTLRMPIRIADDSAEDLK